MKKNIAFSFVLFSILFYSNNLSAQSVTNRHYEVGYHFDMLNGIQNSAVSFKIENKKGDFWRMRGRRYSYLRSLDSSQEIYEVRNDVVSLGYEKRALLKDRISLYAGVDATFLFDWSSGSPIGQKDKDRSFAFGAGLGVPVGIIFQFSDHLFFHLESIPSLIYRHEYSDETSDRRFDSEDDILLDFQGSFVGLTYRWEKKKG